MMGSSSGEWLESSLLGLSGQPGSGGVDLDADLISGLVSFCELAPPPDAADYLKNILGPGAGQHIIQEYLQRRGYVGSSTSIQDGQTSTLHAYMKPSADENGFATSKKQSIPPKDSLIPSIKEIKHQKESTESSNSSKGNSNKSRKKKAGKAISLAEAAKGSVVFKQGEPCACQARRHKLVSNCLSCGKIVCEQEGEGPCTFCGALVLKEGSTYAGLEYEGVPLSDAEAAAEAYAKRLVEYDRNSAARTTVIDDQSDYYEFEGNSWLSEEEKSLLRKKQKEIEEADALRKGKLVITFDLLGRKVMVNKDEAKELESASSILRPPDEKEQNRIKPNPTVTIQPVFVSTGPSRDQAKAKAKASNRTTRGLCLEISGRVQHDSSELRRSNGQMLAWDSSGDRLWADSQLVSHGEEPECSRDYN